MLFFVPTHTDRRLARTPWVNYTLVALNLIVFVFTIRHQGVDLSQPLQITLEQAPSVGYWLWPDAPNLRLYQFISYQFLHASWEHLLFNMLFLYVFGNATEDHLGPVGYLLFYLAGGVIAGLGHTLFSTNPVLGASGSVSAVTGAYLALFPLSNVTIFYWVVVFIGRFEVSSMILILFRVVQDAVFQFANTGNNTAYAAHLAGYGFGFIVGMALLLSRMLPREPYDMLSLIEQKRRRALFQRQVREGYKPWENTPANAKPGEPIPADQAVRPDENDTQLMDRRAAISSAISDHRLDEAASLYTALLNDHPSQVLSRQAQLDISNQLMSDQQYIDAARAYELFLKHYPDYNQRPHIQLILGLIHARHLQNPDRARELLAACRDQLAPDDRQLADTVLKEIS